MAGQFDQPYYPRVRKLSSVAWMVPIAAGALLLLWLTSQALLDTHLFVQQQLSQAESEFGQQLGLQPAGQQQACMQGITKLMQRERRIQSIEF